MSEIKSAWEIAMEKIGELEELTPEELRKQQEERYTLIGQTLADKYLGRLNISQLDFELDKYKAKERERLKGIVTSILALAIEMGNYEKLEKIIEGISYLKQIELPVGFTDEIKHLFQEYEHSVQEASKDWSESGNDILQNLGISGVAVLAISSPASVKSRQVSDNLARSYAERLELLKQKLIQPLIK